MPVVVLAVVPVVALAVVLTVESALVPVVVPVEHGERQDSVPAVAVVGSVEGASSGASDVEVVSEAEREDPSGSDVAVPETLPAEGGPAAVPVAGLAADVLDAVVFDPAAGDWVVNPVPVTVVGDWVVDSVPVIVVEDWVVDSVPTTTPVAVSVDGIAIVLPSARATPPQRTRARSQAPRTRSRRTRTRRVTDDAITCSSIGGDAERHHG
jgi:hypothetical protein